MKLVGIYKSDNSLIVKEDYVGGPIEVSMNEYFVFENNGIVGYLIVEFESTVFGKGLSYSDYIGNVNWEGEGEFVFHLEDSLTGQELDFSGYILELGQVSVTEDGLESRIFKRVK